MVMVQFEDFRGTIFTPKDLHRRLVSVYCELFYTAMHIARAREVSEVELEVRKAKALIEIAKELTELYKLILEEAERLYKK